MGGKKVIRMVDMRMPMFGAVGGVGKREVERDETARRRVSVQELRQRRASEPAGLRRVDEEDRGRLMLMLRGG